MLKRFIQRVSLAMTKTVKEEVSASEAHLHHVETGRVEKHEKQEEVQQKPVRIKVNKYALLMAYQGKEYYGMQLQKDHPTIESHLMDAMLKLEWITQLQRDQPINFHFQRAARTDKAVSAVRQVCAMQLPVTSECETTGPTRLNELLPKDIRVVAIRRATNFFHPQKMCDARTYSYTLPTFAFAKPTQLTTSAFRITQEVIDEINSTLDIYLGTHNFFNYTSKREFKDRSCNRYITSFQCGQPFLYKDSVRNEDVEFITITVKGQSFILHQIRKMIGMVITVIRELNLKSYIQKSFEEDRLDVPKAPGLGLLLERVHYDNYDKKHANTHKGLTFWGDEIEAEVEKIKFELITKEILESELQHQSMMQWLADLVNHDFSGNPEEEETPKKSFVTMAAAKAAEAVEAKESSEVPESGELSSEKKEEITVTEEVKTEQITVAEGEAK